MRSSLAGKSHLVVLGGVQWVALGHVLVQVLDPSHERHAQRRVGRASLRQHARVTRSSLYSSLYNTQRQLPHLCLVVIDLNGRNMRARLSLQKC